MPQRNGSVAAIIGYSFLLYFSYLAIRNLFLIPQLSLLLRMASLLWLLLVLTGVILSIVDDGGIRQFLINRLGAFSNRQVVRATPEGSAETISFGFLMFGRFLSYLVIDVRAISSIGWHSGQGTAMAGRDLNDWTVVIWYHSPRTQDTRSYPEMRVEEVFVIGEYGTKASAEAFGSNLVEFLKSVGIELQPGRTEREFKTPSRPYENEGSDSPGPIS
ncbi:MAG: hypothetical protein JNL58_00700 [Planctomyces sp.]|nr:hypothetical protein [Planctomyces sp.]